MELVWLIFIGLIAGWLAGQFIGGGGFGIVGDIVVGIFGALIGGMLFHALGVGVAHGLLGDIVIATVGAVTLLFFLRLLNRV